jgi:hypothetical protein
MGLIDRIRAGEYRPDKSRSPVVPGRVTTLAEVATLMKTRPDQLTPVRDFLDQTPHLDDHTAEGLLHDRPAATTDRVDALLGAIAENLAAQRGIPCPAWAVEPDRFLDRLWYVSDVEGLRAVALAETPIALKRRGVIWSARSMERV